MKYLTIVFAICMIAYCECNQLVDYRLSSLNNRALSSVFGASSEENNGNVGDATTAPTPTQTPFTCLVPGLQCKDCNTVVNCLDMGGKFLEITTATCTNGETCNKDACSKESNHKCGGLGKVGFKCNAIGMFPNAADCQKFYICVQEASGNLKEFEGACDSDRAYDMTTTYCNLKLGANKQCPSTTNVPTCNKPGSTFVLANKSIFGMCIIETVGTAQYLVPRLYLCPNGGAYTPATYKCA